MKEPLVSILMECYNNELFVGEAIQSIINQTYKNWELIIVDDASSDSSCKVIGSFIDPRIKFRINKNNIGNVASRNNSIKIASGSYVAFIDSDDIWDKDKLELQVAFLSSHKNLDGCFTWAKLINNKGHYYKSNKDIDIPLDTYAKNELDRKSILRHFFYKNNFICNSSPLLKYSSVKKIGPLNNNFLTLHDFEYWVRYILSCNVEIIPKFLTFVRRDISNKKNITSRNDMNIYRHHNELMFIIFNYIENINLSDLSKIFDSDINKKINNSIDLLCEKFFLLIKWGRANNNVLPSMWFYNKYSKNNTFISTLKKKYKFDLHDYYRLSANIVKPYPIEYYDEYRKLLKKYNSLSLQIEEIYNSRSWKVTKPLRKLSNIFNNV